jgi:hypothetical protein
VGRSIPAAFHLEIAPGPRSTPNGGGLPTQVRAPWLSSEVLPQDGEDVDLNKCLVFAVIGVEVHANHNLGESTYSGISSLDFTLYPRRIRTLMVAATCERIWVESPNRRAGRRNARFSFPPRYFSMRKIRMVPPRLSFPLSSMPLFDGVRTYFPSGLKATAPTPNIDT